MYTRYDPKASAGYAKEITDRFGKEADVENNPGPVDHAGYPHGVNPPVLSSPCATMDPVVRTPNRSATRTIPERKIQPPPKEHFGIYACSEEEIHLENYCAEFGEGRATKLAWAECPTCEGMFFAKDDYLCRGCRASL